MFFIKELITSLVINNPLLLSVFPLAYFASLREQ
jgi:hypothetical protein